MIRLAELTDVNEMASMIRETWQTAYSGIIDPAYPPTIRIEKYVEIFTKEITESIRRITVFDMHGKITGLCCGIFHSGEKYDCVISGLYIHTAFQGQGIGIALFKEMRDYFIGEGCRKMLIWTLLGAKNNSFYEKMGGIPSENEAGEIGGKSYPGVGYVWELENK